MNEGNKGISGDRQQLTHVSKDGKQKAEGGSTGGLIDKGSGEGEEVEKAEEDDDRP